MLPADRAKQFMPFAAVKGLEEALERKRREMLWQERKSLSEEMQEALNEAICALKKGDFRSLTVYRAGEYLRFSGKLEKIDRMGNCLFVSGERIAFEDLLEITKETEGR